MESPILGVALMVIDAFSIIFRGKRCGVGKSWTSAGWQPARAGLEQLTKVRTPRVFSMQLYFAHVNGASITSLSHQLKLPEEWVEESVESARMCVEFEPPAVNDH
jgi:hypothetical protein